MLQLRFAVLAWTAALVALSATAAQASGGVGMPWETPLENIVNSITGPVARAGGVIAIVLVGIAFAFSEGGTVLRRLIGVVFGLTIAFAAASFFLSFFGFAGAAAW
jgi:type IV secretion system protein VirB2